MDKCRVEDASTASSVFEELVSELQFQQSKTLTVSDATTKKNGSERLRGDEALRIVQNPASFNVAANLGKYVVRVLEAEEREALGTNHHGGKAALRRIKARLIEEFTKKKKKRAKRWGEKLRSSHLQRLALAHVLSTRYRALGRIDESKLSENGYKGLLSKSKLLRVMFYLDSLEAETLESVWGWADSREWGVQLLWAV